MTVRHEILKQLWDQTLHFFGSAIMVWFVAEFTENVTLGVGFTALVWGFREGTQYHTGSYRWWDQPMDLLFIVLGMIAGAQFMLRSLQ